MSPSLDALLHEPHVRAAQGAVAGLGGAWIVGGTVRDALLGRPLGDVDLAVRGDPEQAARAIGRAVGGPVFQLSERFGSWRVAAREGPAFDVSPLQGEAIEADLAARDFAVNALALPLAGGELIDPHGGRRDLDAGVLHVLGERAYAADPLRPLRLARLATELPLSPDAYTERLTRSAARTVATASGERVFAELRRIVAAERVVDGIALCARLGLVESVLPELAALRGVEQSRFHHLDVYEHTLEVLRRALTLEADPERVFGGLAARLGPLLEEPLADELSRREALRLAALVHDIGKPATRAVRDDGRVTFIGHDAVGEQMVRSLAGRLRMSERLASFLARITRTHLALGFLVHERPLPRRTVYRYLSSCRPVEVEVTVLSCADRLATRGRNADPAIGAHLELARELLADALSWRAEGPPRAPIRGDDLARELGIEPGPGLGALLAELEEARFAGEIETRAEAIEHARREAAADAGDR